MGELATSSHFNSFDSRTRKLLPLCQNNSLKGGGGALKRNQEDVGGVASIRISCWIFHGVTNPSFKTEDIFYFLIYKENVYLLFFSF